MSAIFRSPTAKGWIHSAEQFPTCVDQGLLRLQPDAGDDLAGLEVSHGDRGARFRIQTDCEPVAIKGERADAPKSTPYQVKPLVSARQ